jgi:murein DD-endopeptidase MepM/ murein hydrolase activator NlpD
MDVYMLPFVKGTEVAVTQGNNSPYSHYGKATYAFDFSLGTQDEGTLLVAAASGTVASIKEDTLDSECGGEAYAAKGNHLVISHDDGFCDLYLHLTHAGVSEFGLTVGAQVSRGQPGQDGVHQLPRPPALSAAVLRSNLLAAVRPGGLRRRPW